MMKFTLYQVDGLVAKLKAKVEAGEIDGQQIMDDLESMHDTRYDIMNNLANWREKNAMEAREARRKAKDFTNYARSKENQNKWIDGYMMHSLVINDQKHYHLDNCILSVRNVKPKVIVDDATKVPKAYVRTKTTKSVDKKSAYNALKNGELDGMHLEENKSLNIK